MRRTALVIVASLAFVGPHHLHAQVPTVAPPRRDTVRARPDTTRRDTTKKADSTVKELIKWNPTDSVM